MDQRDLIHLQGLVDQQALPLPQGLADQWDPLRRLAPVGLPDLLLPVCPVGPPDLLGQSDLVDQQGQVDNLYSSYNVPFLCSNTLWVDTVCMN